MQGARLQDGNDREQDHGVFAPTFLRDIQVSIARPNAYGKYELKAIHFYFNQKCKACLFSFFLNSLLAVFAQIGQIESSKV